MIREMNEEGPLAAAAHSTYRAFQLAHTEVGTLKIDSLIWRYLSWRYTLLLLYLPIFITLIS